MSRWQVAVVLAVVLALAAVGVVTASATEEDLSHAVHNPPGNTAIAFPLAQGVAHVAADNSSTGGMSW